MELRATTAPSSHFPRGESQRRWRVLQARGRFSKPVVEAGPGRPGWSRPNHRAFPAPRRCAINDRCCVLPGIRPRDPRPLARCSGYRVVSATPRSRSRRSQPDAQQPRSSWLELSWPRALRRGLARAAPSSVSTRAGTRISCSRCGAWLGPARENFADRVRARVQIRNTRVARAAGARTGRSLIELDPRAARLGLS
jgi:hypothetical protein